jgi:hypothetical protein
MTARRGSPDAYGKNSPVLAKKGNEASEKPYHARAMSWAQRLKRVFNIDITVITYFDDSYFTDF